MPDFSWIPEIPDRLWLPDASGGHYINTPYSSFATPSGVPADMPVEEVMRAFDAWKQDQAYAYELFVTPPPGNLRLVRGALR